MQTNSWRLFLVLGLAVGLGFLGSAEARRSAKRGSTLERVTKSGQLRVGMTGTQPPFNMLDRQGNLMGVDVDLVDELAKSMGVDFELVPMPFKDLIPALEKGDIDMIASGMTITPARNLRVSFIGPYMVAGKSILTTSSQMAESSHLGEFDAKGHTIAVLNGSTSESLAEATFQKAKIVSVDEYQDGVDAVLAGKVTALLADRPVLQVAMLKNPDRGLLISERPFVIEAIGVALPPRDMQFFNHVESLLEALEKARVLEDVVSSWLDDDAWLDRL